MTRVRISITCEAAERRGDHLRPGCYRQTFGCTRSAARRPSPSTLAYRGADYHATLKVAGLHNAINAAGAFGVLVGLGFDPQASLDAIADFDGTERRFELRGEIAGVKVFDDFAHHPTEIRAALSGARDVVGAGRLIPIFQPHLYSRTRMLAADFAETLERLADHTIVFRSTAHGRDPEPGVTGELIASRFQDESKVDYIEDWQQAVERAAVIARDGDFVISMGGGDVYLIIPQLLAALQRAADQRRGPRRAMKRPEGFDPQNPGTPAEPARGAEPRKPKTRAQAVETGRQQPLPRPLLVPRKPREPRGKKAAAAAESGAAEARPQRRPREKEAPGTDSSRQSNAQARKAARVRRRYERSEVRRFTRRSRHRRLAWLTAALAFVALCVLVTVAVYSPLLALKTLRIEGASRVSAGEIRTALKDQLGTPLALVDFGEIKKELAKFPLIRSYVTESGSAEHPGRPYRRALTPGRRGGGVEFRGRRCGRRDDFPRVRAPGEASDYRFRLNQDHFRRV